MSLIPRAVALIALVGFVAGPAAAQIEGSWLGTLNAGVELRIVFHIERGDDGALTATMDSPDQGANGIPTSGVRFENDSLRIDVAVASGHYEGVRVGSEITGTWHQGGAILELNLKPTGEVQGPERPQEPKPPYPYEVEDFVFPNTAAGIELAGTFTKPSGDGPFTAVVLVSGSGPQNRNEELLGHKPFLVLADYLTRRGFAVLRYDDRGVAESTGDFATATTEDLATDASAAVDFLKARSDIGAVGIMGHSEGGLIAPMVASSRGDLGFIVMLAGTGVNGEEILYRQAADIARANGAPDDAIEAQRDNQFRLFQILKREADPEQATAALRRAIRDAAAGQEMTDEVVDGQVRQINSPWFRFFLEFEPVSVLRQVTCPVLAVFGEKDLQVPPSQNIEPIRAALTEAGNADFTITEFEGLNHLFQSAETGSPTEYARITETMSPEALAQIGDWLAARFGPR